MSFDNGANWQPLQLNLPVTPITDIAIQKRSKSWLSLRKPQLLDL